MMTHLNSASLDSDGNRLVPLHGIRIALGLALLAACAFLLFTFFGDRQLHEDHLGASGFPDPPWMLILRFALPSVPFLLSGLFLSKRSEECKAGGAGVAAGLFVCGVLFALAAFLSMFFGFFPDPYALAKAIAILTFLACSVWIIVLAFRIGKACSRIFSLAFGATLIFMAWGNSSLGVVEYKLDRQNERQKAQAAITMFEPVGKAQHQIASLAGCLLLNHSLHPKDEYPSSLDPPLTNWPCETKFSANAVREYTLGYVPPADSASGPVTDFQLIAIPVKKGTRGHYAFMVDSRGIVFSDPMWGISKAFIRAATSEGRASEIEELRGNIEHHMKEKGMAAAPLTLNAEAIGTTYSFQVPSIEHDGRRLEMKNYVFYYLAPHARNPSRFALSAQCQSYGQNCLRSYFLDYGGVLHATGEPRQATADDPPALECELTDLPCRDVVWPVP